MLKDFNFDIPSKALLPIEVTVFGIVKEVNFSIKRNAPSRISVTELGIVSDVRDFMP